MTKITKRILSLLLALLLVFSCSLPCISAEAAATVSYSTSSNSGERGEPCLSLSGTGAMDYYTDGLYDSDTLVNLSGDDIYDSLHALMTETHTKITVYNDCRDKTVITDCENNDGRIVMLYTSYSATYSQYNNGNNWNREHLWPQSLGGEPLGKGTKEGGADLHHIRPVESGVNSTRGNKPYGYANGGKQVYGKFDNSPAGKYSTYYEPLDNVKGDVARIILYVYVRWGSAWGADSVTEVFESVDVLLEWCALDPVDTWEMGRNEVVENIQGNRNVFIDYPEYAWILFDREVPSDMTTPSGLAKEIGVKGCDHENTELRGSISVGCATAGYTGDLYCIDCGVKLSSGSSVSATENHSFGQWTIIVEGGTKERACTGCGKKDTVAIDSPCEYIESDADRILIYLIIGYSEGVFVGELSK